MMLLEFRQRLDTLCDDQMEVVVTVARLYPELLEKMTDCITEFSCSDGWIASGVCKVMPHASKCQRIVVFNSLREAVKFAKRSSQSFLFFDQVKSQDEYDTMHSCCPECGNATIERTCVGWMPFDWQAAENMSGANCVCGWRGVVHGLKP